MALKASPDDQALLLDLQAIDTRLQQLEHQRKSLPEHGVLSSLGSEAEAIRATLAEQSGAVEDTRAELSRVESDVSLVEARIARDVERSQSSSSVKDVAGLEHELVALRKRLDDLEEIELTVMEKLEEQEKAASTTSQQLDDLQSRIVEVTAARDAALATIDSERNNSGANRRTIEAKVPADLLALYEKQRARYGIGASHLRGGVSSASGVKLNSNDMQAVRAAAPDDVLLCPDSSAVLIRTSESGL
jgi:predicted  nucleic acid-binding Zn-ribbon protein